MPLRPSRLPIAAAFALALAGCSTADTDPPCPPVYIVADTSHVTQYQPGPGRDLTNVESQAEIVGYHGECTYERRGDNGKDWTLGVDLQVAFAVKRGPADTARKTNLSYFLAIPTFYPSPDAKAIFPITVDFPPGMDTVRYVDKTVHLSIPVKAKEIISKYEIDLGFQTTPEELEYNRTHK